MTNQTTDHTHEVACARCGSALSAFFHVLLCDRCLRDVLDRKVSR